MQYNLWFNLCALMVLVSLLTLYYRKFQAPFSKYKLFASLVWLSLASTVASLLNNILPGHVPVWLLRVTNISYFLAHNMILPILLLYIYSLTDYTLRNWQKLIPWLLPSAFTMLLIATSWYSDTIFWLDEAGGYHRGDMMPLLYFITAFNFFGVTFVMLQYKRLIPPTEWISVVVFLIISASAVLIQMFFPWLLVENFASAMCMMISQLSVQNPELIMDGSTGMLNKQGFSSLVEPLLENQQNFPLGFLLVDNYHELEKVYGFERLEGQLSVVTAYLKSHSGSIFARLDNRLFCFVPANLHIGNSWAALFRDLDENTLMEKLKQERVGVRFRFKLGIVNCPQDVDSFGGLTELIDSASKLPMGKNENFRRFTSEDMHALRRRKMVDELVRSAVADGSLRLVYQPIFDRDAGKFVAAEALLRMETKKLGFISPAEFIPIAEENGSILQLTNFVLETVCNFLASSSLVEDGLKRIHINLSSIDGAQPDLPQRILEIIRNSGVEQGHISVEITETAYSTLPERILANLTDLSRAGVSVMLDDYGTGYSNLNRLYSMPLDVVKLDKSLVDDIRTSEPARIVLEGTVAMLQRLDRQVLAEGVETAEQADYLASIGIHLIQGYYYAKPMEPGKLEELFHNQAH